MRDIDIRRALLSEMERRHAGDGNTILVEELGICNGAARVDVAVVNGSVHGYEIKSERDTLQRLPLQICEYNRVFDYVTIVVSSPHLMKVKQAVPKWWGISLAEKSGDEVKVVQVRQARKNASLDRFALAQLLWRDEALEALAARGLDKGMRSKPRERMWAKLANSLTERDLGEVVRSKLKRRGPAWRDL